MVSTATANSVAITSMSFASLLASTPAGVYIGAFAGAAVYVVSSPDLNRFTQITYFVASFFLGILGANMTTGILAKALSQYLPDGVVIEPWLGATVTATLGVLFLIALTKVSPRTLITRVLQLLTGGNNDGNK
ncbi:MULTISPECIES: putative holin [Serratia]|uniref:putative holin n=1 Tax=Serratia TaxID=613 RepID=UPI00066146A9|nr:putative holin [Serratia sp. 506_PEND]